MASGPFAAPFNLLRLAVALTLACGMVAIALPGASARTPSSAPQPPAAKTPPAKAKAPAPDPNVPDKEFSFTIASGAKIKATIYPNRDWPGKVVRFDPYFPRTDVNLHSAALNSMWEIYGRQRGSFQASDASVSSNPKLGAIVVYRLKTGAKFCVYPVSSDEKGTQLAAIKVWME
jgi:hypothetical protein